MRVLPTIIWADPFFDHENDDRWTRIGKWTEADYGGTFTVHFVDDAHGYQITHNGVRFAGGNGERRSWADVLAGQICERYLMDGCPPIFNPVQAKPPHSGDPYMGVHSIAEIAHETLRLLDHAEGIKMKAAWQDCTADYKQGFVYRVWGVLSNPYSGNHAGHDHWVRCRRAEGWEYGEVKDAEAKTHPYLVSFNKLPKSEQIKHALFRGVVLSFRARAAGIV